MSILIIYIAKEVETKRFNGDTAHSRGELGFISLPYLTSSMARGHHYCNKRIVNENTKGNFFQKMLKRLVQLYYHFYA